MSYFIASELFFSPNSDHALVLSAFNFSKTPSEKPKRMIRCLSKSKADEISKKQSIILQKLTFLNKCVNEQQRLIKDIIILCIDSSAALKHVPLKHSNNTPWIDKIFINLSKKRDTLYITKQFKVNQHYSGSNSKNSATYVQNYSSKTNPYIL